MPPTRPRKKSKAASGAKGRPVCKLDTHLRMRREVAPPLVQMQFVKFGGKEDSITQGKKGD